MNGSTAGHPTAEQLAAFDQGRLAAAEWEEVERHVSQCRSCWHELETLPDDPLAVLLKRAAGRPTAVPALPPGPAPPMALAAHPRYRVVGFLGAGGMGTVYKAEHRLMERLVALKVLHAHLTARPAAVERFRREVKAAARLSHPNIVTAFDADEAGGDHFLVMEYVEGESLDRLLERSGPLPVPQACELIRQAAIGLDYASNQGMVHRDLKPANLLVMPAGQVKILDFGLARFAAETGGAAAETPPEALLGTPDYIAPEQARPGGAADVRADIYSLGCTLYHLLAGRPPFPDGTILQKVLAHQDAMPTPLLQVRGDVPRSVAAIVDRMLAKDPAQRFQSAAELSRGLEPFTHEQRLAPPRTGRRRRRWAITMACATVLIAAALLVVAQHWQPPASLPDVPQHAQQPAPSPVDAPAPATQPKPRVSSRRQLEDWLEREAVPDIERALRADVLRKHDAHLKPGTVFVVRLSPDLLRSGKATFLLGREDDFFALFPQPSFKLPPGTMVFQTSAPQDHQFAAVSPVTLSALTIAGTPPLNGFDEVRGKVAFANEGRVHGDLALRLTVLTQITQTLYYRLDMADLPAKGTLDFEFPPIVDKGMQTPGFALVLLDLCILHPADQQTKAMVVSNGLAIMLNLTAERHQ